MAIFQQTLEKLQHFPLHPVASEAATFTDFDGDIQVILDAGAAGGSGTMTGKIQHSDTTTAGDFSDVTGGGFTAVAQAVAKQVLTLNRDALKRYVRFVGTIASSGTTIYSVNGYGLKKYG